MSQNIIEPIVPGERKGSLHKQLHVIVHILVNQPLSFEHTWRERILSIEIKDHVLVYCVLLREHGHREISDWEVEPLHLFDEKLSIHITLSIVGISMVLKHRVIVNHYEELVVSLDVKR